MSNFFRKDDLVTKVELGEKLWELEGYVSKYLRTFGLKDGILEDAVQETLMNGWMHLTTGWSGPQIPVTLRGMPSGST